MKGLGHKEFGNYQLIERIDDQHFSTTFKAIHKFTKEYFALKIAFASEPQMVQSLKEVYGYFTKNTAQLNHPNIVALNDFFVEEKDGKTFFVLVSEFVDGSMLDVFLKENPALTDTEKQGIATEVGETLAFAHNFIYTNKFKYEMGGFIHGDLNPWNILILDDYSIKIADFNILNIKRLFGFTGQSEKTEEDLLEVNHIKENYNYTPDFYAPEQVQNDIISVKTDVYHYGLLLFYIFSSKHLNEVFSEGKITRTLIEKQLSVNDFSLRKRLSHLIYKATSSEKGKRYSGMEEMLNILNSSYKKEKKQLLFILFLVIPILILGWLFYNSSSFDFKKVTNTDLAGHTNQDTSSNSKKVTNPNLTRDTFFNKEKVELTMAEGNYYALLIGNEEYKYLDDLKEPIDDILAMKEILHEYYDFQEENIRLIKNGNRAEIIEGFESLTATSEADKILILYAGHGKLEDKTKKGFWMPIDASPNSMTNWISNDDVKKLLRDISAKHILLIADACFSGAILRRRVPPFTLC